MQTDVVTGARFEWTRYSAILTRCKVQMERLSVFMFTQTHSRQSPEVTQSRQRMCCDIFKAIKLTLFNQFFCALKTHGN